MQSGPYGGSGARGAGGGGNGGGSSGDIELLRQLIEKVNLLDRKVDDMGEAVGRAATREDLRAMVPRDTYEVQQRADVQRGADLAARVTALETQHGKLKDELHAIQLDDARAQGDQRVRLERANTSAARGDSQQAATFFDTQSKVLLGLVAVLGTAVVALLTLVLSHPLH